MDASEFSIDLEFFFLFFSFFSMMKEQNTQMDRRGLGRGKRKADESTRECNHIKKLKKKIPFLLLRTGPTSDRWDVSVSSLDSFLTQSNRLQLIRDVLPSLGRWILRRDLCSSLVICEGTDGTKNDRNDSPGMMNVIDDECSWTDGTYPFRPGFRSRTIPEVPESGHY